jgi:hypothetical protein
MFKPNLLESIGSVLMGLFGPVHDAILKPEKGQYVSSETLKGYNAAETENAKTGEFAPYDGKTLYAYVGGTFAVTLLAALAFCGKLGKKKPARRRRRSTTKRTYKRRK